MQLTDIAGSFDGNIWKDEVNVRDFIQYNYTPYEGDDSFLAPPTENTLALWDKLSEMFKVEREKGLYDVETRLPQSVTTYGAGYIDKDKEVVVGLQTDAPLKRGIFPKGGVRMVENALNAYGYELDNWTKEIFTKYRRRTTKVCSRLILRKSAVAATATSSPVCPTLTAAPYHR